MPEIIKPQTAPGDTTRQWVDDVQGRDIPEFLTLKVPTLEQSRFDRRVMLLTGKAVGAGAAMTFTFDEEIGSQKSEYNQSFIVRRVDIINEATARRLWYLYKRSYDAGGAALNRILSRLYVPAAFQVPLVAEGTPTLWEATPSIDQYLTAPFVCWRNIPGRNNDSFYVNIQSAVTAADQITVTAEIEFIPDAAQNQFISADAFTVT